MKGSKAIPKDQTTQFIETITHELNSFFNKISKNGYSFQCIHTPEQSDNKAIELKKSYRIFKKYLISQKLIDPELGQKARQRFACKVWQQLNEAQQLKYFTNKHFPPVHYLQKLVLNIAQKKKSKTSQIEHSEVKKPKSTQNLGKISISGFGGNQNKNLDKKVQKSPMKSISMQ